MKTIVEVEVKRLKLDDGSEPWRTYVDGVASSIIEIDEDSTVRIWSNETTLRLFIPELGDQPKVDVILDRGEVWELYTGPLASAIGPGHHAFVVVGLEDNTFVVAEFIRA